MSKPNAYTTMQRARSLRERHPDASPSLVAVALAAATFADGPTGTSIRPGHDRIAEITGLSVKRVHALMQRLVKIGELRRDKPAWRGSAACYTYTGGMVLTQAPPLGGMVLAQGPNGGAPASTHQSHPAEPSGPSALRDGEAPHPGRQECSICRARAELNKDGLCTRCLAVWNSGDPEAIERLTG